MDVVRHEHHGRSEERSEGIVDSAQERIDGSIASRVGAPSVATPDEDEARADERERLRPDRNGLSSCLQPDTRLTTIAS